MQKSFTVYPYRWVVLLVFALLNGVIQLDWITFAPITVDSIALYGVSAFWIVLLSMSFMVVYIFVSFPASYIIDRYGIRIGVGIGAVLTGVFGYIRGAYGHDYTMICVSQFALAVAQPFIMNAITKVAAEWFPINERATASGIVVLLQFIGIIVAMALTKPLAASYLQPGQSGLTLDSVQSMLLVYGIVSAASAVLFIVFAKDKPPTPPSSEEDAARYGIFDGMKHLFRQKDMLLSLGIFFIGLGMFNAITTYIDIILSGKGFTPGGNEAGDVGAVMMLAGIFGAVVMPAISDKVRKRKLFLVLCMVCLMPGLAGLTFFRSYGALIASSAVFGFFFMAAAPIGYQYAAEVSHPAPESTSQGLIVLSGQISGTIFITIMALLGDVSIEAFADATKASHSVSMTPFMIGYIVLALVNVVFSLLLRESKLVGQKMI
jgi:MFS family permease